MRSHQEFTTASDADLLGGTPLDVLEAGGQLDIFAASTVGDGLLSIRGPNTEPLLQNANVELRANGTPSLQDSVPFSVPVLVGGHYTVDYTEVSAATAGFFFVYRKRGVDF